MNIQFPGIKEEIKKVFENPIEWLHKYGDFYVIEYIGADSMFREQAVKDTVSNVLDASRYISDFPKEIKQIFDYLKGSNIPKDAAEIMLEIQKSNILGGPAKDKANFIIYDRDYTIDKRANVCKEWKESATYVRLGLGLPGISKEKKVMKRNDMIVCLVRSWLEGKWN